MDGIQHNQAPIMLNPADWQNLTTMDHISEEQKLGMASGEFEATLVRQYLKDALKPLIKGAIEENGVAHDIYRGYYTDILSQSLTKGNGIGVSNVLQSQLSNNHQSKETDAS